MSFDLDKGFEIENGVVFNGNAGLISFEGNPIGNPAPLGTLSKDPRGLVWRKFGLPNNSWEVIGWDRSPVSTRPTYSSGKVDYVEYFSSETQITTTRIAKSQLVYSGNKVTSETLTIYDDNGTTVLRTIVHAITYSGAFVSNIVKSES